MKKYFKFFLCTSLFILSFLTFSSATFAVSNAPIGDGCVPDSVYSNRVCSYCPDEDGSRQVVFDWKILWNDFSGKQPLCVVTCGLLGNRGGLSIPCDGAVFKDGNNYAGGSNLLKTNDFVIFRDPKPGSVYKAVCCVMNQGNCIEDTKMESKQMVVESNCGKISSGDCENPFSDITSDLTANKKVTITEVNFADWADTDDGKDFVSYPSGFGVSPFGSGNKSDILGFIEREQVCQNNYPNYKPEELERFVKIIEPKVILSDLYSRLSDYKPTRLVYGFRGGGFHAVIALNMSLKSWSEVNNLPLNKLFTIDVFDPNEGLNTISCKKVSEVAEGLSPTHPLYNKKMELIICDNFALVRGNLGNDYIPCDSSSRARSQPTKWIIENEPGLRNFSSTGDVESSGAGVCFGMSDFITRVACYGDFSGIDYHPNDGNQIGVNCDENHKPLKSSKIESLDWLASVFQLVGGMFKLK